MIIVYLANLDLYGQVAETITGSSMSIVHFIKNNLYNININYSQYYFLLKELESFRKSLFLQKYKFKKEIQFSFKTELKLSTMLILKLRSKSFPYTFKFTYIKI